ncbi:bifunctional 3'-5' exonuclease/DNA polymerase [Diaminobutyricimonas sp. TR449]|uniref:bifunctional 3'-5' exonuclease/DNA polymerase n=1 Tax=Diaminobutyricimonas sp. TR449 TaxID=2708076 RepID=UPI0014206951|nr:bifunctional 3'-5' exonuclease/DNA polymerase [Diaminobutyricimonas sp. TR449]
MHIILSKTPDGILLSSIDSAAEVTHRETVTPAALPAVVREREHERPRWVWSHTALWYPPLLASGVTVERCVDLRLSHVILRGSELTADSEIAQSAASGWDESAAPLSDPGLFELEPSQELEPVAEFQLQQRAIAAAPAKLRLLLAAESAGALIAAEMTFAGLPWDAEQHDRILAELLGPRPISGYRPAKLEAKLAEVRDALGVTELNPDSPGELLKALRSAGLLVDSTRSWDLQRIDHPAIPPLLEFKKLSRLHSANGWHWLDSWVADGRFRPTYVPGGVVTGRWASDGGGALQLPHQVRDAVRADPGWKLVVADVAQLEPRILAAMSGDRAMAKAGRGVDLYAGMVASGAVETRDQAKVGMLGAMYGGTTGESGRVLPRLARAFPQAIGLVERAARAGERGEMVSTWLGRSSPQPGPEWRLAQSDASTADASAAAQSRARSEARSWGRFTRNFVVQGTAAEWALSWMAGLRMRLRTLSPGRLTSGPHLVFFLHDEVIVHTPAELAADVAQAVEEAAHDAGRLLFGDIPVDFRVSVATVDSYADAK